MQTTATDNRDLHKEFRTTYLGAVPHTIVYAVYWLIAPLTVDFIGQTGAILLFLVLTGVGFPVGELVRKFIFKARSTVSSDNKLPQLLMLIAFTVPLGLPVVYMAVQSNINWFFSATAIIVGAHYLPFYYGYKMPSFLVLGSLLIIIGVFCAFQLPRSFAIPAYITGIVLMAFALINLRLILGETRQTR